MKLSKAQRLAIVTTIGPQVEARPNTLASLVRLGLAERRTERGGLTGRAVARHYLTDAGQLQRAELRGDTAEAARLTAQAQQEAEWAAEAADKAAQDAARDRLSAFAETSRAAQHAVSSVDQNADDTADEIARGATDAGPITKAMQWAQLDGMFANYADEDTTAEQLQATYNAIERGESPSTTPAQPQPGGAGQAQQRPAGPAAQPTNRRNPAMTDDREAEPTRTRQPVAPEAIRLATEVKLMTDSDADVDYAALARLDEMPEDEAVEVLDEIMRGLMFD